MPNGGFLATISASPVATGRPAHHPTSLLKIYNYGYLNRIRSSRRLERVTGISISAARAAFPSSDVLPDFSSPRLR
jgi:hypothetical protein